MLVAKTNIEVKHGAPRLCRTMLPLPAGEPVVLSGLSMVAGGDPIPTQTEVCKRDASGKPLVVEVVGRFDGSLGFNGALEIHSDTPPPKSSAIPQSVATTAALAGFSFEVRGRTASGAPWSVSKRIGSGKATIEDVRWQSLGASAMVVELASGPVRIGTLTGIARLYPKTAAVELLFAWSNFDTDAPGPDIAFDAASVWVQGDWQAHTGAIAQAAGDGSMELETVYDQKSGLTEVRLVPEGDHILPQLHQRHFRLILTPAQSDKMTAEFGHDLRTWNGWGVCQPGEGLWSYFSEATPHYTAHRTAMPTLAGFDLAQHRSKILAEAAKEGQGAGDAVDPGFFHPWGIPYGGGAGGDELETRPRPDLLAIGTPECASTLESRLWRLGCRPLAHPTDSGGLPRSAQAIGKQFGPLNFALSPSGHSADSCFPKGDPFGLQQANAVAPTFAGSEEMAESVHRYGVIDEQHGSRLTGPAVAMYALTGDPLARLLIVGRAKAVMLSMGHGALGDGKTTAELGWLASKASVDFEEKGVGQGIPIGRALAWNVWAVAEAFMARWETGAEEQDWLRLAIDAGYLAQMPSGLILRNQQGKNAAEVSPIDPETGEASKPYHHNSKPWGACLQGSAYCAAGWCFDDVAAKMAAELAEGCLRGQAWAWNGPARAPFVNVAVAPPLDGSPLFSSPQNAVGSDDFYLATLIGDVTDSATALSGDYSLAVKYAGTGTSVLGLVTDAENEKLIQWLSKLGLKDVGMRASLISLAERLGLWKLNHVADKPGDATIPTKKQA